MADNLDLNTRPYYRVAWELALKIATNEDRADVITADNAREYFMNLYNQCYDVVYHGKTYDQVKSLTAKK